MRTRNARLSAVHALFRYAALDHPEQAAVIARVLAIPHKRGPRRLVTFLSDVETDALLAAPDRATWTGRRDHTLLALAIQTGLRVSELTGLRSVDLHLAYGAHVNCLGKGRKQRITPLTKPMAAALRTWLTEGAGVPDAPVFPTRTGQPLSRDAIAQRLATHVATAASPCGSDTRISRRDPVNEDVEQIREQNSLWYRVGRHAGASVVAKTLVDTAFFATGRLLCLYRDRHPPCMVRAKMGGFCNLAGRTA